MHRVSVGLPNWVVYLLLEDTEPVAHRGLRVTADLEKAQIMASTTGPQSPELKLLTPKIQNLPSSMQGKEAQ